MSKKTKLTVIAAAILICVLIVLFAPREKPLLSVQNPQPQDVSLYQARLGTEDVTDALPIEKVLPLLASASCRGHLLDSSGRLALTEETLTLDLIVDDETVHIYLSPQKQYAYNSGNRLEIITDGDTLYTDLMSILP